MRVWARVQRESANGPQARPALSPRELFPSTAVAAQSTPEDRSSGEQGAAGAHASLLQAAASHLVPPPESSSAPSKTSGRANLPRPRVSCPLCVLGAPSRWHAVQLPVATVCMFGQHALSFVIASVWHAACMTVSGCPCACSPLRPRLQRSPRPSLSPPRPVAGGPVL